MPPTVPQGGNKLTTFRNLSQKARASLLQLRKKIELVCKEPSEKGDSAMFKDEKRCLWYELGYCDSQCIAIYALAFATDLVTLETQLRYAKRKLRVSVRNLY